jgi:hypothetical protein
MKSALLILVLAVSAAAQESNTTSTVYVYQTPHARMMKRAAPEVFCDGKLLAEIDGGRYFVVKLNPGEYSFHSKNKKNGGVLLKAQANGIYYLRVEMEHTGYFLKFSGISVVQPEQGEFTVRQLRAIQRKYIKDPRVDAAQTEEATKTN